MTENKIESFSGEYRWLSNFWPCDVVFDNHVYASVEHAYVASKTLNSSVRMMVRSIVEPGKVKRFGRGIDIREDWEDVKVPIMDSLLRQKFKHPELRKWLIDTRDTLLVEGNSWGDTFWGVCSKTGNGTNILGVLLMNIRDDINSDLSRFVY